MSVGHSPRPSASHRARTTVAGVRGGRPPTDRAAGPTALRSHADDPTHPDPALLPLIVDPFESVADDPTHPDPALLPLIVDPFESVADAHERLTTLESTFRERGDRRGAFLCVYARVTEAVGAAIDAGEFADPEWVTDYLVTFADLYREALLAYETGDLVALPDPWQVAFETAARGDALVVQDVVLGINAHVNYDLALALQRVGVGPDRRARYADHCAVNAVLRSLVDEVQDRIAEFYAPGVTDLDESFGRLDEALSMFSLRGGTGQRVALCGRALLAVPPPPATRAVGPPDEFDRRGVPAARTDRQSLRRGRTGRRGAWRRPTGRGVTRWCLLVSVRDSEPAPPLNCRVLSER
jgi:hypothetical protein